MFYFPISQQHGIHQFIPDVFKQHSTANTEDIENLFKLMETAEIQIDNVIEILTTGLSNELTVPKVTMVGVPDQLQKLIESEVDQSPFFEPFKNLDNFNDNQISTFQQRARSIITAKLIPAYEKLLAFVEEKYIPQCRNEIGIFNLPGGNEKYLSQIQYYTTTDMTAKDIHNLGLLEVKRIKEEMEIVKNHTGFKGNLSAFNQFLRTDPQFFHKTREELIRHYRDICKRIDPELVKLFGKLPRLPYGVIPVPDYLEKYSTTAYYQSGSMVSGIPGYFYANTYALKSRPKWEMEALSLHEAVPGHHLQIALAQEILNQPDFKKFLWYTVYVEGWGLYAESLGSKLGMYKDDYSKYGQLTYEMWRAIRLVVDTGIHSFGWSRKEAITYFMDNSPKPIKDIEVEIDRYIAWPGQALAYKIGELKIKELKLKAKDALGDKFDVRKFHDMLLSKGSLPLYVLEQNVEDWIKEQTES
jgi:prolyl oligopeptidase